MATRRKTAAKTAAKPAAKPAAAKPAAKSGGAPLATYAAKRDFSKTREPKPRAPAKRSPKSQLFVIQKHAARRLHYDLRLELDGVLKSWAVTRGPSLEPGEKRLAVQVEDHPLDYADFEGTIPKGEYGGGEVIVWDRGAWTSDGDPHKGLAKGHLDFTLDGEKLHGRWHLVRMRARRGETKPQWLLIKSDDDAARMGADAEITERAPLSVKTGRPIEALVDGKEPEWSSKSGPPANAKSGEKARPAGKTGRGEKAEAAGKTRAGAKAISRKGAKPLPAFIEPCLATLVDSTPDDPAFIHEIKFDGYRIQIRAENGRVKYLSRSGLDYTDRVVPSPVHDAVVAQGWDGTIVDGELVVEGAGGLTDFSALQGVLKKGDRHRLHFVAFDCLFRDGHDLRGKPLAERKALLRDILPKDPAASLRYSEEIRTGGKALLDHACRLGLEGIVSKRADAPYRSGRGRDWVKSKCVQRDEFVIAGFTQSTALKRAVGALILGAYEKGKLMPVGRAGSGFTTESALTLHETLSAKRRDTPPFAVKPETSLARGANWTEPEFVADIEYRGVTPDGALRHPVFKGLRDDKDPRSVTRNSSMKAKPDGKTVPAVTLTHPERILWPDAGVTKQGLYDYYESITPFMGPHVFGRPLALIRCPDGAAGHCFFQKHEWAGLSDKVRRMPDPNGEGNWLVVDDFAGLAAFAQAGVLEIHPWGSRIDDIERPDRIIFDLDPGDGVSWTAMIEAAREIRERLRAMKLESFVKTSGGKGLHVVLPLKPALEWPAVKDWTHDFANAMAADSPQHYVATIKKAARTGKILVDYLRNGRGATAVAAFSPRARPGAPVSAPVEWDELDQIAPAQFSIGNILSRLDHLKRDPWDGFLKIKQTLPQPRQGTAKKTGTRRKPAR